MARTNYYVNSRSGNDTLNDGRSPAAPYKTVAKAFTADRNIFIATGMAYDSNTATMIYNSAGTPRTNIVVTAYEAADSPSSDYPVLECGFFVDPLDSGWTLVAGTDGIWKKSFNNGYQQGRLFVGAYGKDEWEASKRSLGEAVRRAAVIPRDGNGDPILDGNGKISDIANPTEAQIIACISPYSPYYPGKSAVGYSVYLQSSPTIPPPLFYGGLYISGIEQATLKGSQAAIDGTNIQDWDVSRVRLRGAPGLGIYVRTSPTKMAIAQDAKNLYFHDLEIVACLSGVETGLYIAPSPIATVPTIYSEYINFEHITYDLFTNINEQEEDVTYHFLSGGSDGMKLGSNSRECTIHRCTVNNAGHGGITIQCTDYGSDTAPQRCTMSYNTVKYDRWTTYANPGGCSAGQDHAVHHNTVDGAMSGFHLAGGVHFYKNDHKNQRPGTHRDDWKGTALSMDTSQWDCLNGFNDPTQVGLRYIMTDLIDVLAEQNSFSGVFTHCFEYTYGSYLTDVVTAFGRPPLMPAGKMVFRDNVILGEFVGHKEKTLLARFLVVHNNMQLPFQYQIVQNNITNIPNPNGMDEVFTQYNEPGQYGDGTNSYSMNGMTGSTGNTAVSDPKVDSAMNPLPTSPLIGTATFIGYMPDIRGVQESNPPSKGARAYQVARPSRF